MKQQLKTYVTLKDWQELWALEAAIRLVASPVNGSALWSYDIEKAILKFQRKLATLKEKSDESYSFRINTEEKENLTYAFNNTQNTINTFMSSQCSQVFNKLFA